MRIILACHFHDGLEALRRDTVVASVLDLSGLYPVPQLDAESEIFERALQLTKNSSGGRFDPIPTKCFSKAEEAQCSYFQLESRKALKVSDADEDANLDYVRSKLQRLPGHRIKLVDRIVLSRVASLRPNEVASPGQALNEFVVASGAAQVFQKERLTGFELRPVTDRKTQKNYEECHFIFSDNLMPTAEIDLTTIKMDKCEGNPERREVCCLSYRFEGRDQYIADFNRTAEAWGPWDCPEWIVSARVKNVFQAAKLKGWAFRPVLQVETELHAEYIAKWTKLRKLLAINPGNRV